jgi:hypothetical protein
MATAIFRATMAFNWAKWGFSETFIQSLDTTTTLNAFAVKAANLMWRRVCILSPQWRTYSLRVSREGTFRDSRVFFPATNYAAFGTGVVNDQALTTFSLPSGGRVNNYLTSTVAGESDAVEPQVTLLCRAEAGELHRRSIEFHGIPEAVVGTTANQYVFQAAGWSAAFDKIKNELTNTGPNAGSGPWQVRAADTGQLPVTVLSVASPDTVQFQVRVPIATPIMRAAPATVGPVVAGDLIQIRGVTRAKGVNGLWKVLSVSSVDPVVIYTCTNTAAHLVAVPPAAGYLKARARYYLPTGFSMDVISDEELGERAVGRPFGLSRGRNKGSP